MARGTDFEIVQWNCRNLRHNKIPLHQYLLTRPSLPHFLLLQETRMARTVPGYRAYHATMGTPLASFILFYPTPISSLGATLTLLTHSGAIPRPSNPAAFSIVLPKIATSLFLIILAPLLERALSHSAPRHPTSPSLGAPFPFTDSDHFLIHITTSLSYIPRWHQVAHTDWQAFRTNLLSMSFESYDDWTSCISATVSASSRRVCSRHPIPDPDPHFLRLWRRRKRLQRSFRSQPQNAQLSCRIAALRAEIVTHGASLEHATKALTKGTPSEVFDKLTSLYIPPPLTPSYPSYSGDPNPDLDRPFTLRELEAALASNASRSARERLKKMRAARRAHQTRLVKEISDFIESNEFNLASFRTLLPRPEKSTNELTKINGELHAEMSEYEVAAGYDSVLEYEGQAAGALGLWRHHILELSNPPTIGTGIRVEPPPIQSNSGMPSTENGPKLCSCVFGNVSRRKVSGKEAAGCAQVLRGRGVRALMRDTRAAICKLYATLAEIFMWWRVGKLRLTICNVSHLVAVSPMQLFVQLRATGKLRGRQAFFGGTWRPRTAAPAASRFCRAVTRRWRRCTAFKLAAVDSVAERGFHSIASAGSAALRKLRQLRKAGMRRFGVAEKENMLQPELRRSAHSISRESEK
ncbi:hypothetical protein HPB49_012081 [Dermacentor silvarum]|uniref:Uncharacterized protein n=1 Tax=Dermacentor silvarum TaxID=543639 RepID=A0ACB8E098_DERSI|nr:hypothetical protein HPB49_012081 [Dermacentor silvarum]